MVRYDILLNLSAHTLAYAGTSNYSRSGNNSGQIPSQYHGSPSHSYGSNAYSNRVAPLPPSGSQQPPGPSTHSTGIYLFLERLNLNEFVCIC